METTLLTVKQISELYGIPLSTVYELMRVKTNACPKVRGGGGKHYLVEKSVFEEWLKGLC